MIKKLSLIALTLVLTTSCVSKKIYTDLENKYANLKKENRKLSDDNGSLTDDLNKAKNEGELSDIKFDNIEYFSFEVTKKPD